MPEGVLRRPGSPGLLGWGQVDNQGSLPARDRDYFSKEGFGDLPLGTPEKSGQNVRSMSKGQIAQPEEIWVAPAKGIGVPQTRGDSGSLRLMVSGVFWLKGCRRRRLRELGTFEPEAIGGLSLRGFRFSHIEGSCGL